MRAFYIMWPIAQTVSAQLEDGGSSGKQGTGRGRKTQTVSAQLKKNSSVDVRAQQIAHLHAVSEAFPLPWSHYVRLLTVDDDKARAFYEREALRNGWTVRQLDRQVATRFYERTGLSRNKTRMLSKGAKNELEEALIQHLEHFLLELGGEFAFVARQRNVRIGKQWYRVDLLFFHRRLRCLVVIDLKVGRYTHADAGQMNLYLNYAQEHWMTEEENPPVGLVLCTERDDAVAHYSLNGLTNRVMAREYRITLPKEKKLEQAIEKALRTIERRKGR
jgi:predicted nuclease of restriction endonuclease-like (RecB) superfamily